MKSVRSIIKESIIDILKESKEINTGTSEKLNDALKELDSIGQEAKIAAQNMMGMDPLSYFYPYPGSMGSQYSVGMQFRGTDRTRRVRKRITRSDGVEADMTIPVPEKDPETGDIIIGPDGEPETYRVKVYETIPLGGLTTFSDKLVKARVHVVPFQREMEIYGLMGGIEYLCTLPLFRKREVQPIDKGVFIYSFLTSGHTPNGADRSEVFGMGSEIEHAMIALGRYAGIVPEDYDHHQVINIFRRISASYQKSQQREEERRKNQEAKDQLSSLLSDLRKK